MHRRPPQALLPQESLPSAVWELFSRASYGCSSIQMPLQGVPLQKRSPRCTCDLFHTQTRSSYPSLSLKQCAIVWVKRVQFVALIFQVGKKLSSTNRIHSGRQFDADAVACCHESLSLRHVLLTLGVARNDLTLLSVVGVCERERLQTVCFLEERSQLCDTPSGAFVPYFLFSESSVPARTSFWTLFQNPRWMLS